MLLLVIGTLSVSAYADDDRNERDDDRNERDDDHRSTSGQTTSSTGSATQSTKQVAQLEQRIVFLEKQIENKDAIIAEQMKIILMLVDRISEISWNEVLIPKLSI